MLQIVASLAIVIMTIKKVL